MKYIIISLCIIFYFFSSSFAQIVVPKGWEKVDSSSAEADSE